MTPTQILSLARDVLIIGALAFILWYVHTAESDRVKVHDLAALQKQLALNQVQENTWRSQQNAAAQKRDTDLASVRELIASHSAPILVCPHPTQHPSAVPTPPGQAPGTPASPWGADKGPGGGIEPIDVRPRIKSIEEKYETALAECRAMADSWPTTP